MGQQQLLLIILGVVIVGLAVSVAIVMYNDHLITANRDDVQRDLVMITVKAQHYYYTPHSMAGGGNSFVGLTADAAGIGKLISTEFSDNENGTYSIQVAGVQDIVIVQGRGKVMLPDGTYPLYYCRVRARKYLMQEIN
ncbi:MAG: hypothetical protein ACOYNS_01985 [Bacteroidota bacterium]